MHVHFFCHLGISKGETADLVIKGTEVYEELKEMLSPTLLPGNSAIFKQIQRYHMDFLRDYNDDDMMIKAKKRYSVRLHLQNKTMLISYFYESACEHGIPCNSV